MGFSRGDQGQGAEQWVGPPERKSPLEKRRKKSFSTQSCNKTNSQWYKGHWSFSCKPVSASDFTSSGRKGWQNWLRDSVFQTSGLRTATVHFPHLMLSHILFCALQPLPFREFRWPVACAGISSPNFILPDIFGIKKNKPHYTHTHTIFTFETSVSPGASTDQEQARTTHRSSNIPAWRTRGGWRRQPAQGAERKEVKSIHQQERTTELLPRSKNLWKWVGAFGRIRPLICIPEPCVRVLSSHRPRFGDIVQVWCAHRFVPDPLQVPPWAKVFWAARDKGGLLTASSAPRLVQAPCRAPGEVGGCPGGFARNKCVAFLWVSWQVEQSHPAELGSQLFVYCGLTFRWNGTSDFHRKS